MDVTSNNLLIFEISLDFGTVNLTCKSVIVSILVG